MAQRFQIFAESLKMSEPPRQPRQPKDLPGLLKFCMEATGKQLNAIPDNYFCCYCFFKEIFFIDPFTPFKLKHTLV